MNIGKRDCSVCELGVVGHDEVAGLQGGVPSDRGRADSQGIGRSKNADCNGRVARVVVHEQVVGQGTRK